MTHVLVGELTLDCDTLLIPGAELKIVAYTARSGTPDADKLDLIRVSGIKAFMPAAPPTRPQQTEAHA